MAELTRREYIRLRPAAERKAELLQAELREGVCVESHKVTWEALKERYTLEVADHLADSTATKVASMFALVDRHMQPRPKRLADLNASRISQWIVRLLDELGEDGKPVRTVSTVASHCRHLKAALRWGHKKELLRRVPDITPPKVPKHGKLLKGRPFSFEEFERVLRSAAEALTPEPTKRNPNPAPPDPSHVAAWQEFMIGLWWSGLRLSEGIALSWNTAPNCARPGIAASRR